MDEYIHNWDFSGLPENHTVKEAQASLDQLGVKNDRLGNYLATLNGLKRFNKMDHITDVYSEGTSIIEIFFQTQREQQTTEVYGDDWISLLSDFGGQLGLWLGFSMASLLELLVFCTCKVPTSKKIRPKVDVNK